MDKATFRYCSDEYGCFNNFYACGIKDADGKLWGTSEAAYQSGKFIKRPDIQEKIRLASSPYEAKKIARQFTVDEGWDGYKVEWMYTVLLLKFQQHPRLAEKLLSTGEAEIVEISVKDKYWGRLPTGEGENMLGKVLMKVRWKLREPLLEKGSSING